MQKNEAKERIEKLREQVEDLRYRYHVVNDPKVTDDVKDSLEKELKALEQEFPEFLDVNSPTNRVAGKPLDKFQKVKHDVRMLSLNDAFSIEELEAWEKRVQKLVPNERLDYFCEVKLDGLAVSLVYEDGHFVRGATRGDGLIGEGITQNLKTIESIPLELCGKNVPKLVEVRGEAVMPKKVLADLNRAQEKDGKQAFANTRNAAAGSLRQLDPNLTASRKLDFFGWDIAQLEISNQKTEIAIPKTHAEEHYLMQEFGFKVEQHQTECKNLTEVINFIKRIEKLRDNFPYGTDGVVISVNRLNLHQTLGVVGKAPRYMVAFKYPAEKATTIIKDITVQVGRTGVLTPVAHFEPILVAGSNVSKATLHNIDQIERLDVRIGDTVVIQKAGDVIPEVVEVLLKLRTGKEKKFKMPEACPVCGGKIDRRENGGGKTSSVAYFCNNPKCQAKNRRGIQHFVSIFEIHEIGPKVLDRFQDEGLISDAADLFTLKKEDIEGLERFGEKSAENIIQSIRDHKNVSLTRFIYSLGILHVGEQTAEDLAENFQTLQKLMTATVEEINNIENIGPVVSKSVHDYFHTEENIKFINKLLVNGVKIKKQESSAVSHKLSGKAFVITGTLDAMSRNDAKQKIKAFGGKVAESVSKNTDYVIAGNNPGSKYEKAQELGITVLKEQEFLAIL